MKKTLLCLMLLTLLAVYIQAETMSGMEIMQPAPDNTQMRQAPATRNAAPEFTFHVEPMSIINSYYDYFPGSYDSVPIRMQPSPAGMFDGGGLYLAFQATPEAGAVRRVYYSYIVDGSITQTTLVNTNAPGHLPEGFPSVDMDWETGNPLFSWHTAASDDPATLNCWFAFDDYAAIGFPGIFNEAFEVIRNPYEVDGEAGNEFIWPVLYIGPGPEEGVKRVYITAKNFMRTPEDYPAENTMIAYADFTDINDLADYDEDQWTHITIPQLDEWRSNNIRNFRAVYVCKDTGTIAIVGHTAKMGEEVEPYNEHEVLFLLENTNHGEGEWNYYESDPTIRIDNPIFPVDQGGDGEPVFTDQEENPWEDMRYRPYVNRFTLNKDDQGNYHFLGMFALMTEGNSWYPRMTTTKHVKFNRQTEEFEMNDVYPRSEDGERYLPWGPDPQFTEAGNILITPTWPVYWHDTEDLFHENYHRIISDGPYMVALFQESIKARNFHEFDIEDYSSWASAPETYIYLSSDYGETWSEPIIMNANHQDAEPSEDGVFHGRFTPELQGMIPTYWYLADDIEMVGDGWGRIHLMFFDQNDYGSSIQDNSANTGGTIMYTSLDVDFEGGDVSVEREIEDLPEVASLTGNYPNPFNPETTISYSLPEDTDVKLEVYNVRGQLVKTLVDGYQQAGERQAVWNGTDESGREVGSGVYFYKLATETQQDVRRMVLVK